MGEMEYKCVYVATVPNTGGWQQQQADHLTEEINKYVKRGWKIIAVKGDFFHLVRGYRMQLDEEAA